jgi:NAD(P)-dependent dehydrogenase (short-subunit alcohol dehydrogenase family)
VASRTREHAPRIEIVQGDLERDEAIITLAVKLEVLFGGLDVLVHSAGLFRGGSVEKDSVSDFDRQYRVNVRAPYMMTKSLLPRLLERQGEIVFVNSSAGYHPGHAGFGAYAASKHALRALADSLRAEVNPKGVRVLTVFPGRTATEMQKEVHRFEGNDYDPARFLRPEDVASTVVHALTLPRTAELTELHIRPMRP